MSRLPGVADPSAEIQTALRAGRSLDSIVSRYQRSVLGDPAAIVRLHLLTAQACWEMGRRKDTRLWLERAMTNVVVAAPQDIVEALDLGVRIGHAQAVISLAKAALESDEALIQSGVGMASTIVELAMRMRLPAGRNGAWSTHLDLLRVATLLLERVISLRIPEVSNSEARALLVRVRHLIA